MEQDGEQSGQENGKLSLAVEQDAVKKLLLFSSCSVLSYLSIMALGWGAGAWDYMKS